MNQIPRALEPRLHEILEDMRVAAIVGPRQAGKSTLARTLLENGRFTSYVTLDDPAARRRAADDPDGFVAALARPAIIDEIQRVPDLMLAIKAVVDEHPMPGQFVVTGSSNLLTQRSIADALPGRAEYLRLWPFAQSELRGDATTLIDRLFANEPPRLSDQAPGLAAYADVIAGGGFPDAYRRSDRRRHAYFQAYVDTLLGRDLRDIAPPQVDVAAVTRLLRVLAVRSSETANFDGLGRDLQINHKTALARTEWLEQVFLVRRLRPWSGNLSSRETKAPKLFLTDSGLYCALVGAPPARLVADGAVGGRAVETFVFNELLRQVGWAEEHLSADDALYFYRDRDRREVDVVIESADGRVVCVEVKASANIGRSASLGLRFLRDRLGDRFVCGAVLYTGRATLSLGDRLWAIPLSGLWS